VGIPPEHALGASSMDIVVTVTQLLPLSRPADHPDLPIFRTEHRDAVARVHTVVIIQKRPS